MLLLLVEWEQPRSLVQQGTLFQTACLEATRLLYV